MRRVSSPNRNKCPEFCEPSRPRPVAGRGLFAALSAPFECGARTTGIRGVPGSGLVSRFKSPRGPMAVHRDPFRLLHCLGHASVWAGVGSTPARDEPRACRRSRASRSLPPGEATPRRLPPGEATPRCLPARTCSRALASGRKRARGARRRLLASSHDAGRTGAPLLLAIGRAMADTPVKCRIHVSAGIPRSRLVARRAAGCAGRGCGACWWSCTGATGVRSQRRTRA